MKENLHIHTTNIISAKNYIKYIREKFQNEEIKLSITNHEYMYNANYLNDLCNRFNIKYIPGFGFFTEEGIEFNILNPTSFGIDFLSKLTEERTNWLNLIFEELAELRYPLHVGNLLFNSQKNIEEINEGDISLELCNKEHKYKECTNPSIVFESIVKPILNTIKRIRPTLEQVLEYMGDEHLFLINPENYSNLIQNEKIQGVIINNNTPSEVIDLCKNSGKVIYFGNGATV